MCYCDNADTLMADASESAENKIPQLEAMVGKDVEMKKPLETDGRTTRRTVKLPRLQLLRHMLLARRRPLSLRRQAT